MKDLSRMFKNTLNYLIKYKHSAFSSFSKLHVSILVLIQSFTVQHNFNCESNSNFKIRASFNTGR